MSKIVLPINCMRVLLDSEQRWYAD